MLLVGNYGLGTWSTVPATRRVLGLPSYSPVLLRETCVKPWGCLLRPMRLEDYFMRRSRRKSKFTEFVHPDGRVSRVYSQMSMDDADRFMEMLSGPPVAMTSINHRNPVSDGPAVKDPGPEVP